MYLVTHVPYPLERMLEVMGEYTPGEPQTHDNPGTPGRFDVKAVEVNRADGAGKVDLLQVYDRDEIDEIESRVVEVLEAQSIEKVEP